MEESTEVYPPEVDTDAPNLAQSEYTGPTRLEQGNDTLCTPRGPAPAPVETVPVVPEKVHSSKASSVNMDTERVPRLLDLPESMVEDEVEMK